MTIGLCFWIVMLLWICEHTWANWPLTKVHLSSFLLWFLLFLLGWGVFGFPLKA